MERYRQERLLGKGAFGSALLVTERQSGKCFVVKQVDMSKMGAREREEAKKEVKLLGAFRHPNIVRYRESFVEGGLLCMVMEYADGGDLYRFLRDQRGAHLPEDRVLDLFVQICLAMKHIHDRKVLHRDIKSQNVFLTANRRIVKLGDFGIARVLNSTKELARTQCGARAVCPGALPAEGGAAEGGAHGREAAAGEAGEGRRASLGSRGLWWGHGRSQARRTTCPPSSATAGRTTTSPMSGPWAASCTRCSPCAVPSMRGT